MATDTQWTTSLLDEAAAILEAESMRLQQDMALWESEMADLLSEMPAPRPVSPRVGVATIVRRRSGPMPDDGRVRARRRRAAMPVWPTQRSPPAEVNVREKCWQIREVVFTR
jgi:hypothetical protein